MQKLRGSGNGGKRAKAQAELWYNGDDDQYDDGDDFDDDNFHVPDTDTETDQSEPETGKQLSSCIYRICT